MTAPLLFLSHSGHRSDVAIKLRERILATRAARDSGLKVWLDKTDLQAGLPWKSQIESVIEAHATAFAVIVDPGGVQNWVAAETDAALSAAMSRPCFRFIPVFMGSGAEDLSPFARRYHGISDPLSDPAGLQALLAAALSQDGTVGRPALTDRPFPGLVSMDETWSDRFFGREREVEDLIRQLQANPFVTIVADSGSGKSSLAMAGVGAAWRGGRFEPDSVEKPPPRNWNVIAFRPRANPLAELATAIRNDFARRDVHHAAEAEILPSVRSGDPLALLDTLSRGMPPGETRTLLIVDQGEELFTQTTDATRRAAFCDMLSSLVREGASGGRLRVLMPIRSDFANQLTKIEKLAPLARPLTEGRNRFRLKGMSPDGIRAMVTKPLRMAGFDDDAEAAALADRIVSDLPQHEGDVGLAQFALSEVWRERGRENELLKAYAMVNGVLGALGEKAERLLAGPEITDGQRRRVIPIFLRLVSLDAGALRVTRRTASREEFTDADWTLISRFASEEGGRLLQTSESGAEISHERLITQWPKLHNAITENGLALRDLGQLTDRAEAWKANGKAQRHLTSQSDEEAFQALAGSHPDWLSTTEHDYLQWSRRQHRRNRRLFRGLAVGVVLLFFAAVTAATFAYNYFDEAETAKTQAAEDRKIAEQARADANMFRLSAEAERSRAEEQRTRADEQVAVAEEASAQAEAAFRRAEQARAEALESQSSAEAERLRAEQQFARAEEANLQATSASAKADVANATALSILALSKAESARVDAIKLGLAAWPETMGDVIPSGRSAVDALFQAVGNQRTLMSARHGASVNGVALSADGTRIASGGVDGSVRLWDAATGTELLPPMTGHDGPVLSVTLNSDGSRIASGGEDGSVRLWDAVTGREVLPPMRGHGGSVRSVALSANGARIGSGGDDGSVRLWDAATGVELLSRITEPLKIQGLFGPVSVSYNVALNYDGTRVASGGLDGVRFWDAATGEELLPPAEHDGWNVIVALSTDGSRIASGGADGSIRLWDANTGTEVLPPMTGHGDEAVSSVSFSADGARIASSGEDGSVRLWDAATGRQLLPPMEGHGGPVRSVALSADGRRIASGGEDGSVRLWDAATGTELLPPMTGHGAPVYGVALSADGTRVASGGADGSVRLWDAATGTELLPPMTGHGDEAVNSVSLSADGTLIASIAFDGVRLWDADTGTELLSILREGGAPNDSVALSADGRRIASDGRYGVRLWDVVTKKELLPNMTERGDVANTVALSADGTRIASGGADGSVRLWDAATGGQLLPPMAGHGDMVHSVALSANGTRIASGGQDGSVRLWDAATGGQLLPPMAGHGGPVRSVALSADGTRIASGGQDGSVRLWDAATGGQLLPPMAGHGGPVRSVALSADGTRIASGGDDGSVRLWDATRPEGNLFQVACKLLPIANGTGDLSAEGLAAEIGITDLRLPPDCESYDPPLPQEVARDLTADLTAADVR